MGGLSGWVAGSFLVFVEGLVELGGTPAGVSMVHTAAVVFDLGGVLIDWDPNHLYQKLIPDPELRRWFLTTICSPEWNHELDAGGSVTEAVAMLAEMHPDHASLIRAWWSRWPEMLAGEIPGTRRLAERLAGSGKALYVLTNWSAETWPFGVERYPFLEELFDGVVVSGHEHVAKPDPRIFEILNDRYGLDPHTTVYIDDSSINIESAASLGYVTHLFKSADRLRHWLNEEELLANS